MIDVIKNKLKIKFHSLPVHDKKYLKAKVREYDGVIKTNFWGNNMPKENMHYTYYCLYCYWFCYENGKENFSTSVFRRMQIQKKENTSVKIYQHWTRFRFRVRFRVRFRDAELMAKLKSDSDNDSEQNIAHKWLRSITSKNDYHK